MIKTVVIESMYAYIKQLTEDNGGVPVNYPGTDIPFTYESWLESLAITEFDYFDDDRMYLPEFMWN